MKKISITACLILSLIAVPVAAQDSIDTVATEKPPDIIGIGFTFADQDDVSVYSAQAEMHFHLKGDWLSVGGNIPILKFIKLKEYGNNCRLTGDWPVLGATALPGGLLMSLDSTLGMVWMIVTSPIWLPVVHPALTITAGEKLRFSAGWESEWCLLSYEDGIMWRPRIGIEVMPGRTIGLEAGVHHVSFWSFERSSRSYGWGWYVGLKGYPTLMGT